jgi:lysophospholipase L1-like esterase
MKAGSGRRLLGSVLTVVAVAVASVVTAGPASAVPIAEHGWYLALGDSVAFGYRPPQVTPPADYLDAANFAGYPEALASVYRLKLRNLACPGETTASFLRVRAPSNGCENAPTGGIAYRQRFPLHTNYPLSQMRRAKNFLTYHPDTQLVTIDLGANDLFLCRATTADRCTGADLVATLQQVARNLTTILATLRGADATVPIVVLDYYSTNYADPTETHVVQVLNAFIEAAAQPFHTIIADGYTAFQQAAGPSGDACAAGLLIALPAGGCNVHPSPKGHLILATAVAQALDESPAARRAGRG